MRALESLKFSEPSRSPMLASALERARLPPLCAVLERARLTPGRTAAWLGAGAATYALLYARSARRPRLTRGESGDQGGCVDAIVERCEILSRVYWPHPWSVISGMLSTVYMGTRMPLATGGGATLPFVERLELSDGGTVALSWWRCPAKCGRTDVAVVFPGLNNSSETGFVRALMRRLDAAGYLAVCYDYRGVGASAPLTSDKPFSADAWRDFDDVLEHVIAEVGSGCRLFLVGQSLGGSILTKYLTTTRLNRFIPAAVTVSAPRAFVLAAKTLQDGALNKVQNFCMTLPLKLAYLVNGRGPVPFDRKVVLATSLQEMEEVMICAPWGHVDANAYYEANDAHGHLSKIQVPLLVIGARDDNVVAFRDEDTNNFCTDDQFVCQNPAKLVCCTTFAGGHLGFLDFFGESWSDRAVVDWFHQAAALDPNFATKKIERARDSLPRGPTAVTPRGARSRKRPSLKGVLIGM